jgi:hypothetical protein
MESIPRPFRGADVADRVGVEDSFAHLVVEGSGVFEADETAELLGVHPVALGGGCLEVQERFEVAQDNVEAGENFVQVGLFRTG